MLLCVSSTIAERLWDSIYDMGYLILLQHVELVDIYKLLIQIAMVSKMKIFPR